MDRLWPSPISAGLFTPHLDTRFGMASQLGYEVLLPWSPHLGYDLAYYVKKEERHCGFFVHQESQLVRVQCKTARLAKDNSSLVFNTSTVSMGGTGVWKKKKSG